MEWQPRRLAAHPSQPGMQYSGPPYWAPAMQYVQPWHPAQFGAPWEQMQGWHPAAPSAQFAQSSHVASPSEQLRRERVLDKTYCLIDKDGSLRPFSSVSAISGQNYEQMISTICCSGGPRILRAIDAATKRGTKSFEPHASRPLQISYSLSLTMPGQT